MPDINPFKLFGSPDNSSKKLNGKFKKSWVEESFDIESETAPRLAVSHTKNYVGASIDLGNVKIFVLVVLAGLSIVFLRTFYLQIFRGNYYRGLAEGNRIRLRPIPAERGIIYDRFNKELVNNVPDLSLVIVPQDLPRSNEDREKIIATLSEMSGLDIDSIKKIIKKYSPYQYESLVLKENIDYQTALKIYIENYNLPGVSIESGSKRSYLSGVQQQSETLSLSHLLGYLGKLSDQELVDLHDRGYLQTDNIGRTGLEKIYEPYLRGISGQKKIEVNSLGKEQNVLAVEPPQPGKNLILTIDAEAQNKLENLIKDTAKKTGKRKIAAIAMNPQNGEIISLVSWPAFDNNEFSGGISSTTYQGYLGDPDHPLFNRAIAGTYPPGSTVKPVVAAAALQEKIITKNTAFNSVGGFTMGKWFFKDWKAGGHGITNVIKALAWSVNTFFYYVGGGHDNFVGLGVDRLTNYMSLFNIAQKTGIDLPGEGSGFLPSKEWKRRVRGESWFTGDTYNLSIGEGDLLVTPLQVALWTAAVANGGKVVQPHLGDKIIDPVNNTSVALENKIIRNNFISPENINIVREGMRECVLSGSCQLLKSLPFVSGGKTGTAQWNKNHGTHAWFTSFAPYQDPQIAVTVLVEEGGEGATIAMPIAKNFLEWWGKKYLTH